MGGHGEDAGNIGLGTRGGVPGGAGAATGLLAAGSGLYLLAEGVGTSSCLGSHAADDVLRFGPACRRSEDPHRRGFGILGFVR